MLRKKEKKISVRDTEYGRLKKIKKHEKFIYIKD